MKITEFMKSWKKTLKKAEKTKEISIEHQPLYRFLGALIFKYSQANEEGKAPTLTSIIKVSKVPEIQAKGWFRNLVKNGYFERGRLLLDEDFFEDIGIHLMACVALGFIDRVPDKL